MSDRSQTRAVFVHGNPETSAIWGPLLATLEIPEAVTLSPPGFGGPEADGFGATADEYVAWLARSTWSATTGAAATSCA